MSTALLKGILDRAVDFVRVDERGERKPARPPNDVIADILALPHIPLPSLRGIASTPVLLPNGMLLERDGYDPDSGMYLDLRGFPYAEPSMSVSEAITLLRDELLGEFPFADEGSRAHALALLLQPFVRLVFGGPAPLYLIDAPARGTGKGLLADVVALVATGQPSPVMALPSDENELEKRITACLMSGCPLILLDNVTHMRSSSLAAVLTTTAWRGRILGRSQMVYVRNNATWIATGNNVTLSDEMVRRVIPIRLDAGVERPEERTGFAHPNLLCWAAASRPRLVRACLALVGKWADVGMPRGSATLGRYESWAGVIGGLLEAVGVPGFLSNRERL